MASARLPAEFFDTIALHLRPEQPVGPKGGRPRVGQRVVVRVIWFVLATGSRWEDVPPELGCSGRTARVHLLRTKWEEDRRHQPNAAIMYMRECSTITASKSKRLSITTTCFQHQVYGRRTGLRIRSP